MNSYELSRAWFDFSFENPDEVKPIHSAIYFFAIEHCNRLGWKEKFGFPSQMAMEAIGVKNWRTYSKALKQLVDWGFIKMIETSKNQYSSNIIAIVKNTKAVSKALDKALSKHGQKQGTKQGQSTVSIDKQLNKEQRTNKQLYIDEYSFDDFWNDYDKKSSGKVKSKQKWDKLKPHEKEQIKTHVPKYVKSTPDKTYRKNAETYLHQKHWESEIEEKEEVKQNPLEEIWNQHQ